MPLKLSGATSGTITVDTPAVAGSNTLTLPAATGNVITSADSGTVTSAMIASSAVTPAKLSQPLTQMTAQNSTSGTAIDFTGIPSWVRRITVMLNGVSTNGTGRPIIQLGTSGGVVTSGYIGSYNDTGATNFSSGIIFSGSLAANVVTGCIQINFITSNTWCAFGCVGYSNVAATGQVGGSIALSGVLDRIRITTSTGTDTFDAGSVNVMYEG